MQKWYEWQEYMKKDEKETMEEMHQRKVEKMIKSAERECWISPQNHEANDVERKSADLEGGEIVGSL